jgi:hypothetical protein
MSGHGGWPLNVVLNHQLKPFFAGTYFPKKNMPGRIGWVDLVKRMGTAWSKHRDELQAEAEQLTQAVARLSGDAPGALLGAETLDKAYLQLSRRYDEQEGGFGSAPKFPSPHNFNFALRYAHRTDSEEARAMVAHSLAAMRRGGIFDHVGYGFHRYATDQRWLLPHFEKMLYDQAMLAMAYLEMVQVNGDTAMAAVAREIFAYVRRDLTHAEGGFFSAEDADSEGREGKFYLWHPEEIEAVLGTEDARLYMQVYEIRQGGNFHDEASGKRTGENIPHLRRDLESWAAELDLALPDLTAKLESCRARLFDHRERRIHPLKDDKVLTDWNGLMIAAFAFGGRVLDDETLTETARKAAAFVWERLRGEDGLLLKRYRGGEAGLPGHLDDYAFVIWGLLELHQTTLEIPFLARALELTQRVRQRFEDPDNGGFFLTAAGQEDMVVRSKKIYDGAIPSGNSVMAANMLRLARLTGHHELEQRAVAVMTAFSGQLQRHPSASNHLMSVLADLHGATAEVVIVGEPEAADTRAMLAACRGRFLPGTCVLLKTTANGAELARLAPFTAEHRALDGKATAYFCRQRECKRPTTSAAELLQSLNFDEAAGLA